MKQTLENIQRQIDALKAQASRIEQQKEPTLRKIVKLARGYAISANEIRTALNGSAKRPRRVAAMYRNTKTGETWSGRGRPARWLAAAEKQGRKRTEFLVNKKH